MSFETSKYQLEERECPCGLTFKVLPSSAQRFHSLFCEADYSTLKGAAKAKKFNPGTRPPKTGTRSRDGKIWFNGAWRTLEGVKKKREANKAHDKLRYNDPELKKKSLQESDCSISKSNIPQSTRPEKRRTTSETRPDLTILETREKGETEMSIGDSGTSGINETRSDTARRSENVEGDVIPREDSTEQFLTSVMVASPSLDLLDSTATRLHSSMQSLNDQKDVRSSQVKIDSVHAVCAAAKNIREIMKLKLEALKLQHEINKETGVYEQRRNTKPTAKTETTHT